MVCMKDVLLLLLLTIMLPQNSQGYEARKKKRGLFSHNNTKLYFNKLNNSVIFRLVTLKVRKCKWRKYEDRNRICQIFMSKGSENALKMLKKLKKNKSTLIWIVSSKPLGLPRYGNVAGYHFKISDFGS